MKKEVISYSSFSMAPPEIVELLDNNKGAIINDSGEKIVDLQEHKILHFWDKMDELQVWKWKREYNPHYTQTKIQKGQFLLPSFFI